MAILILDRVKGIQYRPLPVDSLPQDVEIQLDRLLRNEFHSYFSYDPVLGWSLRPNGRSDLYRSNSQGLRAEVDYSAVPAENVLRIATFGDSFTHGDDVIFSDTWQAKLQTLLDRHEILNFGVPAYGPGQAYLRYRHHGRELNPHIVFIGFMTENIYRSVNVYRPFYRTEYAFPLAKPRFTVRDGRLELIPNPMPTLEHYVRMKKEPGPALAKLGERDLFYDSRYRSSVMDFLPTVRLAKLAVYELLQSRSRIVLNIDGEYDRSSEAFAVVTEILRTFYNNVLNDGALPVIVIFPENILNPAEFHGKIYQPLLDWLKAREMLHIDLQEAFNQARNHASLRDFTMGEWRHYSPPANDVVARYIHDWLLARGLDTRVAVKRWVVDHSASAK